MLVSVVVVLVSVVVVLVSVVVAGGVRVGGRSLAASRHHRKGADPLPCRKDWFERQSEVDGRKIVDLNNRSSNCPASHRLPIIIRCSCDPKQLEMLPLQARLAAQQ
jgi:hypothetical protein